MAVEPMVFDSTDVGLTEATVSRLYSRMRISAVGEDTRTQITRRVMGPGIGFDDLDYRFDIGYSGAAQANIIVCEVLASTIRRVGEGNDEVFGPGDTFIISRPNLPYGGVAHAPRLRFTLIDPALLARVAATAVSGAGPVRILGHRPVSGQAARQLQRTTAYIRDTALTPDVAAAPLLASAVTDLLAASVLAAFPNSAVPGPTAQDRRDAHPATLRRAVAFVDEHAQDDISVADIAAAAFVTVRAAQLAFRRHLGTTPLEYLRRVRLEHAHHDLLNADPARTTVTAVAYRWGFPSASRFTAYYRQAYGTTPGQTLRS